MGLATLSVSILGLIHHAVIKYLFRSVRFRILMRTRRSCVRTLSCVAVSHTVSWPLSETDGLCLPWRFWCCFYTGTCVLLVRVWKVCKRITFSIRLQTVPLFGQTTGLIHRCNHAGCRSRSRLAIILVPRFRHCPMVLLRSLNNWILLLYYIVDSAV